MSKVTNAVTFLCSACKSEKLIKPGSARTESNRLYMTFECDNCRTVVNIEVDAIIASLYTVPLHSQSGMTH